LLALKLAAYACETKPENREFEAATKEWEWRGYHRPRNLYRLRKQIICAGRKRTRHNPELE